MSQSQVHTVRAVTDKCRADTRAAYEYKNAVMDESSKDKAKITGKITGKIIMQAVMKREERQRHRQTETQTEKRRSEAAKK